VTRTGWIGSLEGALKNGFFEVGDHVIHRIKGCIGPIVAIGPRGKISVKSGFWEMDPEDLEMVNQKAIQHAFDLGHKAAGGSIVPDVMGGGPWKFVEIAMDRDEIDVIGALVERQRDRAGGPAEHAACVRFLDKIEIFRRKK
jgi:hypothetical protein